MIGEETIFHSGLRNYLDSLDLAQQGRLRNSFGELSQIAAKFHGGRNFFEVLELLLHKGCREVTVSPQMLHELLMGSLLPPIPTTGFTEYRSVREALSRFVSHSSFTVFARIFFRSGGNTTFGQSDSKGSFLKLRLRPLEERPVPRLQQQAVESDPEDSLSGGLSVQNLMIPGSMSPSTSTPLAPPSSSAFASTPPGSFSPGSTSDELVEETPTLAPHGLRPHTERRSIQIMQDMVDNRPVRTSREGGGAPLFGPYGPMPHEIQGPNPYSVERIERQNIQNLYTQQLKRNLDQLEARYKELHERYERAKRHCFYNHQCPHWKTKGFCTLSGRGKCTLEHHHKWKGAEMTEDERQSLAEADREHDERRKMRRIGDHATPYPSI